MASGFLPLVATADFTTRVDSIVYDKDPNYHAFLIPVLTHTRDGRLLAFAEGRVDSHEDDATIHIVQKTSDDNGQTWSRMSVVHADGERTVGNPAAVLDRETGTIWLFFCKDNKEIWLTHTDDGGESWSDPIRMDNRLRHGKKYQSVGIGPGHGIQLEAEPHAGRLLVTAYGRLAPEENGDSGSQSFAIYSDDHGKTWSTGEMTHGKNAQLPDGNECMAVELSDGELYLTIRNNISIQGRAYSRSTDGGQTWETVEIENQLPEPVCQASVDRIELGDRENIVSYIAPSIQAQRRYDKEARKNLTLWLSDDNCKSWRQAGLIHPGYAGYSDQVVMENGNLGCLFACGEDRAFGQIRFVSLEFDPTVQE